MKALEVVDILNKYPSASLVIVIKNGGKRSSFLSWASDVSFRIHVKRINIKAADCVARNYAHQLSICAKQHLKRKDSPTIVTITKRD